MGIFNKFKKSKKMEQEQNEPIVETEQRNVPESSDTDYYETLYSSDAGVKRESRSIPSRREWENISYIERKIDELSTGSYTGAGGDIEKKVDKILSKKLKK
ncbi:MAG TPA: hypothetical protein ENG74_03170 [Thermoplasmatales archaeon]|nr:hypothetical protein [Thermoplasmatales archaeon]